MNSKKRDSKNKPNKYFNYLIWFISLLLAVLLFILTKDYKISDKKPYISKSPKVISRVVSLGFWTHGLWNDETKSFNPEELKLIEDKIGKKVAIAHYFRGWHFLEKPEITYELNTLIQNNWTPMLSANPYFSEDCKAEGMTLYKAISNGNCDILLRKIAVNFKTVDKPFFFRFAWEMNVESMEWSVNITRDYPSDFVSAWRRFHTIVEEYGVDNVIWVFAPQVDTPTTIDISKLYPGDEYVDWIALDGYNWGETKSWSNWQSFNEVFDKSYNKIISIAPSKPLMIAETNTTHVGGDKGEWYKDMLEIYIPNNYPKINAVVFFNEDKTNLEGVNWLIDSDKDSLSKFKKGISNPIYSSEVETKYLK